MGAGSRMARYRVSGTRPTTVHQSSASVAGSNPDALTHRVLTGPEPARHSVAHERDARAALPIRVGEAAAEQHRYAEGAKVVRAHHRHVQDRTRPWFGALFGDEAAIPAGGRTGERHDVDRGSRVYARHGLDTGDEPIVERTDPLGAVELLLGPRQLQHREVVGAEPRVQPLQREEAASEQARRSQNDQGQANLEHDERGVGAARACRVCSRAVTRPQRGRQTPGCPQRRKQPANEHGAGADGRRHHERHAVQPDLLEPRKLGWSKRDQHARQGRGQQSAKQAARDGKECALSEQLTQEPAPPGAERAAYRHLLRPTCGPDQQQVRDVDARDQPQQRGGSTKQQNRWPYIADDEQRQRRRHRAKAAPLARWFAAERCAQLLSRLGSRRAGHESADRHGLERRERGERDPDVVPVGNSRPGGATPTIV